MIIKFVLQCYHKNIENTTIPIIAIYKVVLYLYKLIYITNKDQRGCIKYSKDFIAPNYFLKTNLRKRNN